MTAPVLLSGVDRAAFVAALTGRLRTAGLTTGLTAAERFSEALAATDPRTVRRMYLTARTCLVDDIDDLPVFDTVFTAVFDAAKGTDRNQRHRRDPDPGIAPQPNDDRFRGGAQSARQPGGGPVSWATMPALGEGEGSDDGTVLPEPTPTAAAALATIPFDQLDTIQLDAVGRLIEQVGGRWPTKPARRLRPTASGPVLDRRRTLRAAMRHGGEVTDLRWAAPQRRPRRVVMVADVSGSMKPYARAYMHLMRGLGRHADAETFAFATTLSRLTPTLAHRDARTAVEHAGELVTDRFGGTRIATCLRQLLSSPVWSSLIRGGVLIVASDGWDTDPPDRLAATVARLRRMTHRLIWVNPRSAEPGFVPATAGMAAALPHCDELVSGHTLADVRALLDLLVEA